MLQSVSVSRLQTPQAGSASTPSEGGETASDVGSMAFHQQAIQEGAMDTVPTGTVSP